MIIDKPLISVPRSVTHVIIIISHDSNPNAPAAEPEPEPLFNIMASENSSSSSSASKHILVFPYPAQGHMLSLLDFTNQLASQALQTLTITILVTPKNLPTLTPLLSSHPSIQTLVLPFPTSPSIPPGVENVKDLPPSYIPAITHTLGQLHHPLLQWFNSHPSPPTLILSDLFLGWTHHLASQLGIPRIVYCSSGSFNLSIISELWRDRPQRVDPNNPNEMFSFPKLPNSPSHPWWQLSGLYKSYVQGNPVSEFLRDGYLSNLASWGLVINSFREIESVYLDHLKKIMGHDRVWAVGPLIAHDFNKDPSCGPIERGGSPSISSNQILSWMDKCVDRTVVYVCFGSQTVLTNSQMETLALGLEQSGVKFIWCSKKPTTRHPSSEYGMIPDGFEDRVVDRGLVIKGWAPQVSILRHRAVGAFLTHCGWSSMIESLVAGVPMLTWPMGADQFVNATLLVNQLGVAVKVCEGAQAIPNATAIAQTLAKSVSAKGFIKERLRATELSRAAFDAVRNGGSSSKSFHDFFNKLIAF